MLTSEHGAVDGLRIWLPCAFPWAGAIRREYDTTLGELLTHRSGLVARPINLLICRKGGHAREKLSMTNNLLSRPFAKLDSVLLMLCVQKIYR